MRVFVAVSPPGPVVAVLQALPRPDVASLRWTTEDQWHVTLRFLGEVDDPRSVATALGDVPHRWRRAGAPEVWAVLGPAVAWFPGRQVLQVPVAGLDVLADAVGQSTVSWPTPADDRPFSGHLTLARTRGRARGPASAAGAPLEATWRVESVALMASVLGRHGARYETLSTVPLGT
jgi:2'-5' RNA ligase